MIGAATLATSADPRALVPTDPEALDGSAAEVDGRRRVLAGASADTAGAACDRWHGAASEAWATHRTRLVEVLDTVAGATDVAGGVLRQHAAVVRWAHARAEVAVALWAQGEDLSAAWRRRADVAAPVLGAPSSPWFATGASRWRPRVADVDPGTSHRALAEQVLASARAEVVASEAAAAGVLDGLSAGVPDGGLHPGDFLRGVADWLTSTAGALWRYGSLRAVVDGPGWASSWAELGTSTIDLYHAAGQDPVGTGQALLDTDGLAHHPGRWWGGHAPDLATSLVTGGSAAGVAGAARMARYLQDIADGVDRVAAGERWLDALRAAGDVRAVTRVEGWADYQRTWAGPEEFRLRSGDTRIWADGVHIDPDAVVAVEAKLVERPGASMWEGSVPDFLRDDLLAGFDDEVERYAAVIRGGDNPVERLRIVTSTPEAAEHLLARARSLVGEGLDVEVVVRP
ncbi:restriction endonuclease fold toxin-2 domain-containing protein [Cellulomonas sp. C5510]|uniref:restriction endonuclease fold toxin-2 domain-containing protein n=1 Tax=Cellulomonas sp. C5510 TaxID=2871170 RepID=UPI001C949DB8|nr:restriction endonuclease fold toxin-2 domain-containing protein [Cellulomonas sp. C5510]QZN85816.1 hypothetical protein K5O09_00855 [Cellulomonas sp. C5510]